MADKNKNTSSSPLETVSIAAMPVLGVGTAIQAGDTYSHIDAGWIQQLPGADHLSSATGSFAIGVAGSIVTERIAKRFDTSDRTHTAETIRRIGNAATLMGSLACQVAIETSMRGTGDKLDVIAGVTATMPGILAGRGYSRPINQP